MTRNAASLALALAMTAAPAVADTYVTWSPPNPYHRLWSTSEWWGLELDCGLYPHRGKPSCCQCGPEDNWFVTMGHPAGARLDVSPELAGLVHLQGPVDMQGNSLLVFGVASIGDGAPTTPAPYYVNTAPTAATFTSQGALELLDDHTVFDIQSVVTGGTTNVLFGVDVHFSHQCHVMNLPGATWTLMDETNIQGIGGAPLFENHGTIIKTAGGPAHVYADLLQSGGGAILVLAGELGLDRDLTGSGFLRVDAGALLSMASGGFSTDWSGIVSGAGDVRFGNQRAAVFNGPYDIDGWTMVNTDAHVTFGVPAQTSRLRFEDSSGGTTISGDLTVEDELVWEGGELVGGRLELRGQGHIGGGTWGNPLVDNAQLVLTSSAQVTIDGAGLRGNNGLVENHGAVVLEDAPLGGSPAGSSTFRNLGSFEKTSSSPSYVTMDFVNEGELLITAATLVFAGGHTQTSGRTLLDDGTIDMTNFETFELLGGELAGFGTVDGEVHVGPGAVLSPGTTGGSTVQAGELRVQSGKLVQDVGSTARFDIGGRLRGVEYDAVTGSYPYELVAGGCLAVELVNGFESQVLLDDVFVLYDTSSAPVQGIFDNVKSGQRVWTTSGAGSFQVFYGPGSPYPAHQVVLTTYVRGISSRRP